MIHLGYTLLGFLPVGAAEEEAEDISDRADMDFLQYRSILLEFVPLKKLISSTSSMSGQKRRITVLRKSDASFVTTA